MLCLINLEYTYIKRSGTKTNDDLLDCVYVTSANTLEFDACIHGGCVGYASSLPYQPILRNVFDECDFSIILNLFDAIIPTP